MTVVPPIAAAHHWGFKDATAMVAGGLIVLLLSIKFENSSAEWGFKGGGGPMSHEAKVVAKWLLRVLGVYLLCGGIYVFLILLRAH